MSYIPVTDTGTIGNPRSRAMKNTPFLNDPTVPSRVRVPSGNTRIEWPSATSARNRAQTSAWLPPRRTGMVPRWRMAENDSNDWGLDRQAQRSNTIYTGIEGIHLQDQAITESMGPITDFTHEHLAPSDRMITRTRRRLLMAARALRDNGAMPPGAEDASVYRGARSGYLISAAPSQWQQMYANELAAAAHPPPASQSAAE